MHPKEYDLILHAITKYVNEHGKDKLIVALKKSEKPEHFIVFGGQLDREPEEWGSWEFSFEFGFYEGHYYRDIKAAVRDFYSRGAGE